MYLDQQPLKCISVPVANLFLWMWVVGFRNNGEGNWKKPVTLKKRVEYKWSASTMPFQIIQMQWECSVVSGSVH